MLKASLVLLMAFAFSPATASATTMEIGSLTASVISSSNQFQSNSSQSLIDLSAGSYLLTLAVEGSVDGMVRSWSILLDRSTGKPLLDTIQLDKFFNETLPISKSIEFTLTDDRVFEWRSMVEAANASASYKTTISSVTSVPGPEAGAGLGALALGGIALCMKRGRKEGAAVNLIHSPSYGTTGGVNIA